MSLSKEKGFDAIQNSVSFLYCTNIANLPNTNHIIQQIELSNKNIAIQLQCGDLIKYQVYNSQTKQKSIFFIPFQFHWNRYSYSILIQTLFHKYQKQIGPLKGKYCIHLKSVFHPDIPLPTHFACHCSDDQHKNE